MNRFAPFRLWSAVLAGLLSVQAATAITFNITGNKIQDENGNDLPGGSTVMLIVSTTDADFGNLTGANNASATAFTNDADDRIMFRWGLDENDGGGSTIQSFQFNLGDFGTSGNDPVILVWYSGLQESANPSAPGQGRRFGTFRDVNWVIPGDNSAQVDLTFLTASAGGSLSDLDGRADQITEGQAENVPPTALCQDVEVSANVNCVATVTAPQVDDGSFDSDGTIANRTLTPPGPFGLGNTIVTLTVIDNQGASNSCNATITVTDTTLPSISCPGNIITSTAPGQTSVQVNFTTPSATDNCPNAQSICAPSSGSAFAVGTNLVTCTAIDGSSNTNKCTFQIIVNAGAASNQPPVALCRNVTNSANASCQASVTAQQVDNGSYDPDGCIKTRCLVPAPPYTPGVHVVKLWVIDNKGASNSCTATLTVIDPTPPSMSCPDDITVAAPTNQCSVVVAYAKPVATDNCGSATVGCVPPSMSEFAVGTNTVVCTATDNAGNTKQCSFRIFVTGTVNPGPQPPVALARSITNAANGNCQAAVAASQADNGSFDPDGGPVTFSLNPPGPFGLGSTPVTFTVTDDENQTATTSITITVVDQAPPTVNCPARVVANAPPGNSSAVIDYPAATASDNCGVGSLACVPPSGSSFPLGTNTVTCTATDTAGNNGQCGFEVVIHPTAPPSEPPVVLAGSVTNNAGANCEANVTTAQIDNGSFDPDGGSVTFSLNPPAPYAVGNTMVTFTVTDDENVSVSTNVTITIVDVSAPMISCPENIATSANPGQIGKIVTYGLPTATDNCGAPTVTCEPPSGEVFPLGTNMVQCVASDTAGNEATCAFEIVVQSLSFGVCDTIPGLIQKVEAIPVTREFSAGRKNSMIKKLQAAQRSLDRRRYQAAILQLEGFIRVCEILRTYRRLDRTEATELIACARDNQGFIRRIMQNL